MVYWWKLHAWSLEKREVAPAFASMPGRQFFRLQWGNLLRLGHNPWLKGVSDPTHLEWLRWMFGANGHKTWELLQTQIKGNGWCERGSSIPLSLEPSRSTKRRMRSSRCRWSEVEGTLTLGDSLDRDTLSFMGLERIGGFTEVLSSLDSFSQDMKNERQTSDEVRLTW